VKAPVETVEMTVRVTAEREQGAQLRTLSRALQDVHRSLMETARERYEFASGPVRSRGELLDLLLHEETFAWLGPLSGLIVEIDELAARDPAPTPAETAAMGTLVQAFTSSSDNPDAFGSRYVALLASEPRVAMSHVGLRDALGATRTASRPRGWLSGKSLKRAIERAERRRHERSA
jgi:hypothetical protein